MVLELGGHAPFIVFADADMERAVDCAISAKFATSGQDCLGANRFYIERPVYEECCKRFAEKTAQLTVGRGIDDPDVGPLMNAKAIERQIEHVDDAKEKGAIVLTGAPIPFGGMKQSGVGREGARLGMEEFTEIKYVCRNYG